MSSERATRESSVRGMNAKLFHRGPDEQGMYSDEFSSLAMRRLSIMDLAHGKQPIHNNAKSALVFFNGEIYNFRELRAELQAAGFVFHTNTDTEVVINAYTNWGDQFLTRLKGMFAFCIYDRAKRRWLLARDRFGEKPLYYYHTRGYLSFASEIGSLLSDPRVPRELNRDALRDYLSLTYVPEPNTLLQSVKTLQPGHFLIFSDSEIFIRPYFIPQYNVDSSIRTMHDAVEMIAPVWQRAVKRQMVADVPLGAFLSGGIDSSSVVATMQKFSSGKVKTFTVKFEDEAYDESPIARKVSQWVGTDHHEITVENAGFKKDIFWELIDKIGVPFPDSSAIPSYFVTKEIRKHVKVALSGDGGDELFAGYNLFGWHNAIYSLKRIPELIRNGTANTLDVLQRVPGTKRITRLRQIKKALRLSTLNPIDLPSALHALFSEDEISRLILGRYSNNSLELVYPAEFKDWSPLRRIMHFRLVHNLPLDMLTKVDRMSMANSLEVRAPFLDSDLFDAAATVPEKFLFDQGKGKLLIRQMMKNDLPDEVFDHPKKGFSIPLHKYQNSEFWGLVDELLLNNEVMDQVFDRQELRKLVARCSSVAADNAEVSVYKASHQIWSLLQFSGWVSYYKIAV